ncbi:hypothetical protein B7494_g7341 [Chlorociboria aeruginascens]|nr:hypothetical protein B7494_g7341 [Chlorociboria aeruginascens]
MGQSGPYKGSGSSVYVEAFSFFKKRELQGIKPPKKKVKKEDEQRNTVDLSGITLDGESSDQVEIYDTCDEVRKNINAYLQEPHVTQAGFCREISKTFSSGKKVSAKNLTDFLGKRGPRAGNTSAAYYAAYVFFEKLRLKNGKAKSRHREGMKSIHGQEGGMDTKISSSRGYLCLGNERPREDKFGRVTFY